MTDFDKLIKEKAEQAEYVYRPSAWKQFQRVTGLGKTSAAYWLAGVAAVAVVGGITAFVGYRNGQVAPANSTPIPPVADTLTEQPVATATVDSGTYIVPEDEPTVTAVPQVSERKTPETVKAAEAPAPAPVVNPPAEPVKMPRYGRPLVIDVDTIKENVPTDEELEKGNSRLF